MNSGETRDIYSPFYPSSNGRGIRSITTITGLNGTYIRITVLYVSLTVHATKQQLSKVYQFIVVYCCLFYISASMEPIVFVVNTCHLSNSSVNEQPHL